MKKFKAILALVLVAALMLTLFAACGQSEEPSTTPNTNGGGETPGTDTPGDNADPNTGIDYGEEDEDEIVSIEFYFYDLRMTGADHGERIEAAVNEITEAEINTNVNITYMTIGDWQTKFQLSIGGGDRIDVASFCAGSGVATMYANTMAMDITEYMAEFAPEAMEIVQNYVGPYTYDGKLYGIPAYRNYARNYYIIMRKDILDELGLTEKAENLTTWSGYEEILAAVYEAYDGTGLYPISKGAGKSLVSANGYLNNGDNFSDRIIWDTLGDATGVVRTDDEGNVMLYQESPEYEQELLLAKKWRDNGWVYPDSALVDTHGDELMKQGVTFSSIQGSEIGIETVKESACGYPVVCPMLNGALLSTSTIASWGMGVPITAEYPEQACKFLNLMYTNADLMNLLIWGIEGEDYTMDNGEVVLNPEGGYYQADFLIGNNTLLKPLKGNGADFFERVDAINKETPNSTYLGFSLDTAPLELQISQITAVIDQYGGSLSCGEYTPEAYANYIAQLEAAGVRDYLSQIQGQLDAWLATQG